MIRRNQWTAALLAFSLFACGVAAGALGHRYYSESVVAAKSPAADARQQYLSEMNSKLHLSATQLDQLQTILDETKAKTRAVRERVHPEMVRIKQEQISRVKSILTPQQVGPYEQLVSDRERRARAAEDRDRMNDRKHRGGPHPSS